MGEVTLGTDSFEEWPAAGCASRFRQLEKPFLNNCTAVGILLVTDEASGALADVRFSLAQEFAAMFGRLDGETDEELRDKVDKLGE